MHWRMKHNDQRALRLGEWKYLKVNEHEYLFNIERDARERANQAKREPERLRAMRPVYEAWAAQVPLCLKTRMVSLIYTLADMPSR